MADDINKFSLFSMGLDNPPMSASSNDGKPHNASLFSQFTPEEPDEPEHEEPQAADKSVFGQISTLADLGKYGFLIDLDDDENGEILAEILHYILPYVAPGLIEMLVGSSNNIMELLDRIHDILEHDPDKARDLISELLLEELEKRAREKGHKKVKTRILGNRRQVGLAFEDDLDEDEQKVAERLAKELQRLLEKQKKVPSANAPSTLDLKDINPRATTSERLTFQLSTGGGQAMTVLLTYIIQFAAPAIINTLARTNPNLRGLLTKFDSATLNSTVTLNSKDGTKGLEAKIKGSEKQVNVSLTGFGQTSQKDVKKLGNAIRNQFSSEKSLWQSSGPDKSGPDSGPSSSGNR